jgi:hypothetical protein
MNTSQLGPFCQIDMDDYRRLMETVIARDWIGIAEWGQEHDVLAGAPDDYRNWMDNPKFGVLKPLFNGAWARRRQPEDIPAVWRMAEERPGQILSDAWSSKTPGQEPLALKRTVRSDLKKLRPVPVVSRSCLHTAYGASGE